MAVATVAGVGKLLWTAPPERWRFLFDALHLRTAEELVLLTRLLENHSPPNAELAQALFERGATANELADCQQVLLLDAHDRLAALRAFERLSAPPFSFSASQFGRARLCTRRWPSWLTSRITASWHRDVLAFERCHHGLPRNSIGRLLGVGVPRRGSASADEQAEWAYRALGWITVRH